MDVRTGYVKRGGGHLAFFVMGTGPLDLLYVSTSTISIDSLDEEPHAAHYFRRVASFSRLIRFDVRGVGLSDPIDSAHPPTVERWHAIAGSADQITVLDVIEAVTARPTQGAAWWPTGRAVTARSARCTSRGLALGTS